LQKREVFFVDSIHDVASKSAKTGEKGLLGAFGGWNVERIENDLQNSTTGACALTHPAQPDMPHIVV